MLRNFEEKYHSAEHAALNFDDGPQLPRHFRSSLTRVIEDLLPLGKPTIQILIFRPVESVSSAIEK